MNINKSDVIHHPFSYLSFGVPENITPQSFSKKLSVYSNGELEEMDLNDTNIIFLIIYSPDYDNECTVCFNIDHGFFNTYETYKKTTGKDYRDRLVEAISPWTQELMGLAGGLIFQVNNYRTTQINIEENLPSILAALDQSIEDQGESGFLFNIDESNPWINLIYKTPIYLGSREYLRRLPKLTENKLIGLKIRGELITIKVMDQDYSNENYVYFHQDIGIFNYAEMVPHRMVFNESLSSWTQALLLPPTKITFRIASKNVMETSDEEKFLLSIKKRFNKNNYFVYINTEYFSTDQPPTLKYYEFICPTQITKEKLFSLFKKYDTGALKRFTGNMDFLNTRDVRITDFNDEGAPLDPFGIPGIDNRTLSYLPEVGLFNLVNFKQAEEVNPDDLI